MVKSVKVVFRCLALSLVALLTASWVTACAWFMHGDGTLTIWWFDDASAAQSAAWNSAIEVYHEANPDIKITVEQKSWAELSANAETVLSDDNAPDVVQWVPGRDATGTLVSAGKLAGLGDYVSKYKWNELLPASALQLGQYDGLNVGRGTQYGIPNDGHFAAWYYNADMLQSKGIDPMALSTPSALAAAFDVFAAQGVTPVASAGDDLSLLAYAFTLEQADRAWVSDYQFFDHPVDFNDAQLTYSSETVAAWASNQYLSSNSARATSADSLVAFTMGLVPFYFADSAVDGEVAANASFAWGKFLNPGSIAPAASGNNWVIPSNSVNKDQAAEFINDTLLPDAQNLLADRGGLPLASTVEPSDPTSQMSLPLLQQLLGADAFGFYPQWPVPHYQPVLTSAAADLLAGKTNPAQYRQVIGQYYLNNAP